jgi:quinolinate synthase
MTKEEYLREISRLKKEKNAVLLAHYYQDAAIQEAADFVGDSLELSKKAAQVNEEIIVFAGVHFMAETAKILNPTKKVLIPEPKAGCSLADSCPPEAFSAFRAAHPEHMVITYINCSAEIKALSDIVCTSSNALRIVESLPKEQKIIFAPDKNLGDYISRQTGREMLLWDGACVVHEAFSMEKMMNLYEENQDAQVIAHPESERHILKVAHFIGSTSAMINYVKTSPHKKYIVATEAGILYKMHQLVPEKELIPAPTHENNTCACSECPYMKMNSLEKVYLCMRDEKPEIFISEELRIKALRPIERMLSFV